VNKKEEILKIASKEFAKYGYNGVSLENIAKKAKITKATIFYYFNNKKTLFEAVIVPRIEELIKEIYSFESENPKEELKHYIYSFAKIFKKYPCFAAILAHEFVDGGRDLSDDTIKLLSKAFKKLITILKDGEEKNIFKIDNPFSIQLMIVSALIMHQTTKEMRRRVSKFIEIELNPDIKDIADAIYTKILKAILKD